ncbi:MAG: hypothetical protein GTO03_01000, partial [Planctomycetales bacterium]|nr:hypothetical protein [Planctomycetales bacterium]
MRLTCNRHRWAWLAGGLVILATLGPAACLAFGKDSTDPSAQSSDQLAVEQSKVADSYARFKKNLTDLAEFMKQTDPARAATLEKAVEQMNRAGTRESLEQIVDILARETLLLRDVDHVLDQQASVESQLMALLQLLLTEDRAAKNDEQKTRLRRYIKYLKRARKIQQGLQGQTQRGSQTKELAPRQDNLAKRTRQIADDIRRNEKENQPEADTPAQAEGQSGKGKGDPSAPGEGKDKGQDEDKDKTQGQGEGQGQGQGQGQGKGQGQGQG